MAKHALRRRRETDSIEDRLTRLLDSPRLARIVPRLPAEALHQIIRHRGLEACGELVTSATPAQLTSLLDLDLWRHARPGRDHQFDVDRFGEWLEVLVDTGESLAARTVAALDRPLVIEGLSRYLRIFDPGTFEPTESSDDEARSRDEMMSSETSVDVLECEVGGYLVRARRTDAWDAIVTLLMTLETEHPGCFHALMHGCRRLSNSTPEIDGLDDLLMEPEQSAHDRSDEREARRADLGYSTPADARAFLQMARQRRRDLNGSPASSNPIAAAYLRAADEAASAADQGASPYQGAPATAPAGRDDASIEAIVELLADAGLMSDRPRALIEGGRAEPSHLALRTLMARLGDGDGTAYFKRSQELAFLANTLIAGCSVQGRPFTVREAHEAAAGICNLGLEHSPVIEHEAGTPDLVAVFETGWAVLHTQVSLFVARQLIGTLEDMQCLDEVIHDDLNGLRRALAVQCDAGTPWQAREALEVLAMLDMPAWAAINGLLSECPVLPAALTATLERRTGAVSAIAFEFFSTSHQIGRVRAFMEKLGELLIT